MRKDFALLVAGRFLQALLTVASLRVLTAFLSPAQVGSVYLILSLAAVFGLFLINPVGMYINRKLHAWQAEKSVFSHFFLFNLYVVLVSVLSLGTVGGAKYFFGIGSELAALPLVLAVACYVYASTWNNTLIPAINLLEFRAPFVLLSVLTSGLALAVSSVLVVKISPTAFSWIGGQAAAMLLLAVFALFTLKHRLGEGFSLPALSALKPGRFSGLWLFAPPLAGATFFMWVQNQSYRIIVEKLAGPEFLGFLAVGLGIASSLAAVTESLGQQLYLPAFYKQINNSGPEERRTALAALAVKTLPVYIILTLFVIAVAPQLTALLVDKKFAGAAVFVAFGAFIELFRMTANVLAASAHAEMRTSVLIKPYAAGGVFTVAGVYAACQFADKALLIPAAMAVGGLVTAWVLKKETPKEAFSKLDRSAIYKSAAFSSVFLLLLPFRACTSLFWSALLITLAGAYFLLLQYLAAFKWSKEPPAPAPKAPPSGARPVVCVCVPSYNSAATIAETLESILAQSYHNLRVVVVDNASTDGTVKIVESYAEKDLRVEFFKNPVNIGAERNFSRCIELCSGAYTAIYHADDVYAPGMVEETVAFLEGNPGAGAVFTAAREIDGAGNVIGERRFPPELAAGAGRAFPFDELFRAVLKNGNFLTCPSALVRTAIYQNEIRAWNGDAYKTSADLDVWLRIAERHTIGLLDRPLLDYRVSTAGFSYSYSRLRTERQDLFLVLEDYVRKYSGRLGGRALDDYRLLVLKDDISVAINHVIRNEPLKALARLRGIFCPKNIFQSFGSFTQLKFLAIGYAAFCVALLPLGGAGRRTLARIRHKG